MADEMSVASESLRQRELEVAAEIVHAFLTASHPVEVYRVALSRVTPLVNARFSSVFLRDPADPLLLKLECAHNWPQASARFLGQLRIRVGRGPTGRAVAEREPVEVEDVFADPSQREWWEPARELGFTSLIALPLQVRGEVEGALSFYFDVPHRFEPEERRLLSLIADQLAATAEKARLTQNLRETNEKLTLRNEGLVEEVEAAAETNRLKNEFLANMSHELRTPLTSILGYGYLLSAGHAGPLTAAQAAAVAKIDRAGNVLLGLISDLLDLSHLKLGRTELQSAPEEAAQLAERALAGAGGTEEGVEFRFQPPEAAIEIRTDGEKVVKILENLLSNAFKFTREGNVSLAVRREARHVEWVVSDTGVGIRPEDVDSVFDEFRQVDGSSTRLYGGTGLGLALSRRLARLLGGDVTLASEPGRGSTFTLRLPVAPTPRPESGGGVATAGR
jgi:signal transduction histidine kinase